MARRGLSPVSFVAVAGLTLALAGGCSRAFVLPLPPPPDRDHVAASYEATWKALIRALAADNVPLRTVAKDSGVISSDDIVSPIGVYADCGRLGSVALEGEALITFTMFVQPDGASGTDIQINSRMRTQAYRRGDSGSLKSDKVYPCASTGRWESNMLDAVRRLVKE